MNTETNRITLDENHVYTVAGKGRKVSVSKVLDLYFPPTPFYSDEGREKGTARHLWFAAIIQGLEIVSQPDERIAAEIEGFRKFVADVKPKYIFGEVPLYDDVSDVCGTPDLYCEIQGRPSVIDFKPKNKQERWKAQTAAYQSLLTANGHPCLDRYAVRVLPGDYRMEAHKDANDLLNWRRFVDGYKARGYYGNH